MLESIPHDFWRVRAEDPLALTKILDLPGMIVSGLQLLGHRYYDASVGRFISSDPAKAGDNWYAYCDNNPLAESDPLGLAPPKKKTSPPWQQKYSKKDDAATAVLRWIHKDPKAYPPGHEYGGWIHQQGNSYWPDKPRTQGGTDAYSPGKVPIDAGGDYHTHPPGGYSDIFSGENNHLPTTGMSDIEGISRSRLHQRYTPGSPKDYAGYLGNPTDIRVFTPVDGDTAIPDHPRIRHIKY